METGSRKGAGFFCGIRQRVLDEYASTIPGVLVRHCRWHGRKVGFFSVKLCTCVIPPPDGRGDGYGILSLKNFWNVS
ncbi:hypothetical protein S101450_00311 [Komagataeibacter saccharivorans]|nr:hypothetical protein S101450_00311 [Komagataeibacter saccharivorans]